MAGGTRLAIVHRCLAGSVALMAACGAPSTGGPAPPETPAPALSDGDECRLTLRHTSETEAWLYRWSETERTLTLTRPVTVRGPGSTAPWHFVHHLDERGNRIRYQALDGQRSAVDGAFRNHYDGDRLVRTEFLGWDGATVRTDTFTYDEAGRPRELDRAHATAGFQRMTTTWSYHPDGRLQSSFTIHRKMLDEQLATVGYDGDGRIAEVTDDGGPYVGRPNGTIDRRVSWTYDGKGRIASARTEGALSDVVSDSNRVDQTFDPGCQVFQARFPSIFGLPAYRDYP